MRLDEGKITLLFINEERYMDGLLEVVRQTLRKKPVFMTLSRPHVSLLEAIRKASLDEGSVLFIDPLTPESKRTKGNAIYVSSPAALTEMGIALSRAFRMGFKFLILDSISILPVFGTEINSLKFLHFIITKLRIEESGGAFICPKGGRDSEYTRKTMVFVDESAEI